MTRIGTENDFGRWDRPGSPPTPWLSGRREAFANRAFEDPERGAEGGFGDDRKVLLDVATHERPVVVRRDIRDSVVAGFQAIAVEVRESHIGTKVPGNLSVALEGDDVHRHVVLAERKIVERLAVHVDHEGVANLLRGLTGEVLQHPGRIDGDMAGGT